MSQNPTTDTKSTDRPKRRYAQRSRHAKAKSIDRLTAHPYFSQLKEIPFEAFVPGCRGKWLASMAALKAMQSNAPSPAPSPPPPKQVIDRLASRPYFSQSKLIEAALPKCQRKWLAAITPLMRDKHSQSPPSPPAPLSEAETAIQTVPAQSKSSIETDFFTWLNSMDKRIDL